MTEVKTDTPTVTEEPGKDGKAAEVSKIASEEETLPSMNPLPAAWISTGASWFNSAKEKTKNTLDLMKKDLAEFGDAMTQEVTDLTNAAKGGIDTATHVIKEQAQYLEKLVTPDAEEKPLVPEVVTSPAAEPPTSSTSVPKSQSYEDTLAAKVEKSAAIGLGWMKSVVDSVTDTVKSLAVEETTRGEDDITETIRPRIMRKTNLSPAKLLELQSTESTYRNEPENLEAYEKWVSRFVMEEYDAEINILLANNPKMREIYGKMVPSEIDAKTFWSRYFFAVQIAEMDEELQHSFALKELSVKTGADGKKSKKGESPSSDGSIAVVDQQPTSPAASADDWSVCSEKNYVEEISSTNGDDETGPTTPRPKDEGDGKDKEKKDDNWVDWDE
ncbi:unnamed protein product [Cylicocyclus nassatus]|uniref:BSD domain-containing protein n=1 Tax=Cylicocyclus nassatus TaxID=53992 RepID=A0AA36GG70_CYLNA|nr:unnamed protein product [Cylicocyclus nassatus]